MALTSTATHTKRSSPRQGAGRGSTTSLLFGVESLVELELAFLGQGHHYAGLAVADEEQVVLTGELLGLDDAAVGQFDRHAGGDVEAGFDGAVVAQADADAGVGADQRPLANTDHLRATARERAHDGGTPANVAAVADDHALADAAFDHGFTEGAGIEVGEAFLHDGSA